MTHIERVKETLAHRQPDRTPAFMGKIDDLAHWCKCFEVKDEEELRSLLQLDIRKVYYHGCFRHEKGKDIWGASEVFGAYNKDRYYPLANAESVADIENYKWPVSDALDMEYYRGELTGIYRALKPIGSHLKGELEFDLMLNAYNIILQEERYKGLKDVLRWYTD